MIDADGFRANVGIILANTQGQVLWAKRIGHNAWQFPQGGVDEGETGKQAAIRELQEECGGSLNVKMKGERALGHYAYFFPKNFERHDAQIVGAKVSFFAAEYIAGQVEVDGQEIVDHAWVTKDQLKDYFEGEYLAVVIDFV